MEQSRPRHQEEDYLIAVNRSWFYTCVDFTCTMFFWAYSLLVVAFISTATMGFNTTLTKIFNASLKMTNQDIRSFVVSAIVLFLLFYTFFYFNHLYNKKRFGSLNRRSYPAPTNSSDLKKLRLMDIETIEKLQGEDYTVFDTNPIAPLGGETDQKDIHLVNNYRLD